MSKSKVWGTTLDWTVDTYPTAIITPTQQIEDKSHLGLLRSDNNRIIGYVSDHYETVQNKTLFSLIQPLINEQIAEISYQGFMRYGKIVLLQAMLDTTFEAGNMEHKNFVTITNTHGGKGNIEIGVGNMRMCCLNQFQANKKSLTNKSKFSHRIGVTDQLNLDLVMEFVSEEQQAYQQKIQELSGVTLKYDQLRPIIEDVFGVHAKDKIYNNIVRLYRMGNGNLGRTAYDLFSATTDYVTNCSKSDKQHSIANVLVGTGANQTHKMFENLLTLV
jgi:hypothetical protein